MLISKVQWISIDILSKTNTLDKSILRVANYFTLLEKIFKEYCNFLITRQVYCI